MVHVTVQFQCYTLQSNCHQEVTKKLGYLQIHLLLRNNRIHGFRFEVMKHWAEKATQQRTSFMLAVTQL